MIKEADDVWQHLRKAPDEASGKGGSERVPGRSPKSSGALKDGEGLTMRGPRLKMKGGERVGSSQATQRKAFEGGWG